MRPDRRLPLEELLPYCLPDVPRGEAPLIDWKSLFGNDHPVEIEVGFGKGLFLVRESERCPDINFLGIEVIRKLQLYAATRLAIRKRSNVRVACTDGRILLRYRVVPQSVQAVHIYFPDPWWKLKHKKRRVFNEEFAVSCTRIIIPGGKLYIATDVEEYFGVMLSLIRPMPQFRELPPPPSTDPKNDMDYLTNFERKFRKQGLPIYKATFERTDAEPAKYEAESA